MTQTIDRDSAPIHTLHSPAEAYTARSHRFAIERDRWQRQSDLNGNANVALFGAALIALGFGWFAGIHLLYVVAVVFAAGFVASFIHHIEVDRKLQRAKELWTINDEGLRRLRRDWHHLPLRQSPQPLSDRGGEALAVDLDLLGHASLQHLLNTPGTTIGLDRVQSWLLAPADPTTVRLRQAAVAELAPQNEFRDNVALAGRLRDDKQPSPTPFLQWAEGGTWLAQRPWLIWLSRALAAITIIVVVLQIAGVFSQPIWLIPVLANLVISGTIGRQVHKAIDFVSDRQGAFHSYAELFEVICAQTYAAPTLTALSARLTANDVRADRQMHRLARIINFAQISHTYYGIVVQALFLWDFHMLWLLEQWQRDAGQHARDWLDALGEMEALAALATLAHDHPDWTYPEIVERQQPLFTAQAIGHPLLSPDACVRNDVTIGPPGTFLLVTGSNMSGKSTLLRAIGLNIMLAQAGGPICATSLRLPPVTLATSIRVQDSLEQGVSYFMAELQRLKQVVDAAESVHDQGAGKSGARRTLLFLLDEILHGTNTGERQIAARSIIRHLLTLGTIGAVSTHDLTLADAPDLAKDSTPVHFTENFTRTAEGPSMTFDYHLLPGIATSTNALKLMEIVGLPLEEE
ncbi:MAG TPA: hypothetical protein VKB76_09920 [Ktedonobacterales bacterium]|nr:hypothetical protein [Ktedonobacterales bacterium]